MPHKVACYWEFVAKKLWAVRCVESECKTFGNDIEVFTEMVSPYANGVIDPESHDLALVDETVISKGCSKTVLGSGLPILTFGGISGHSGDAITSLSDVVEESVRIGRLRDYIEKVTDHIDATRQMLVATA